MPLIRNPVLFRFRIIILVKQILYLQRFRKLLWEFLWYWKSIRLEYVLESTLLGHFWPKCVDLLFILLFPDDSLPYFQVFAWKWKVRWSCPVIGLDRRTLNWILRERNKFCTSSWQQAYVGVLSSVNPWWDKRIKGCKRQG